MVVTVPVIIIDMVTISVVVLLHMLDPLMLNFCRRVVNMIENIFWSLSMHTSNFYKDPHIDHEAMFSL